jgi:hypothetical protein
VFACPTAGWRAGDVADRAGAGPGAAAAGAGIREPVGGESAAGWGSYFAAAFPPKSAFNSLPTRSGRMCAGATAAEGEKTALVWSQGAGRWVVDAMWLLGVSPGTKNLSPMLTYEQAGLS